MSGCDWVEYPRVKLADLLNLLGPLRNEPTEVTIYGLKKHNCSGYQVQHRLL